MKKFPRRTEAEIMQQVDSSLETAVAEGKLDNLPGKGKRLVLDTNPFTRDSAISTEILKQNGFSLPFVEERRDIETAVAQQEKKLLRVWEYYDGSEASKQKWTQAKQTFIAEIATLNKKILTYNLKAPSVQLHLRHIKAEERIRELQLSI